MKETYETPLAELLRIASEDVMTASDDEGFGFDLPGDEY